MLTGKKILLGVTGSIAAYKAAHLIRLLVKAGADVKVIMTQPASDFISKLTLSTLSKNKVLVELFDEETWVNHVLLGRWADVMLIAPLTCNTLGKMANGLCDNLLMAVYLSANCPVVIAPAMDEDMWLHPATKENTKKLLGRGVQLIPVEIGELASGLQGEGRMAEPETIIQFLQDFFSYTKILHGKKALVSAGPTYEPIDPVRFIGNHSSGKMGIAIAQELYERGADVTLVLGPTTLVLPVNGINTIRVNTAAEMFEVCTQAFKKADLTVMAAAVADYTPVTTAKNKIKKKEETLTIEFKKTKDILGHMGEVKKKSQVLVGFALETDRERLNAKEKLAKKNADLIVLNSLKDEGAGFATDTNKICIFDKSGKEFRFGLLPKKEVAKKIVDTIIRLYYE